MVDVTRCTKPGCGKRPDDPIHWPSTGGGHTFRRVTAEGSAPKTGWGAWKFLAACAVAAALAVLARGLLKG